MRYYTGVGSGSTPAVVMTLETAFATRAYAAELTLLSGGAQGSDTAFEQGAGKHKHIFYGNATHKHGGSYVAIPTGPQHTLIEEWVPCATRRADYRAGSRSRTLAQHLQKLFR